MSQKQDNGINIAILLLTMFQPICFMLQLQLQITQAIYIRSLWTTRFHIQALETKYCFVP